MSLSISRRVLLGTVAVGTAMALAGCASGDPTDPTGGQSASAAPTDTISVGSAAFGENVILAEVYAQALEANDVKVTRNLQIGEREVYLKALEEGSIDLIPEYTGNLLAAYDADSTATSSDDVYAALGDALPDGFEVLDESPAEDKDSYNVTKEYSETNGVTSLSDLKGKTVRVGGGAVLGEREYGIPGLTGTYGVDASLVTIEDQGGPNTVKALLDGQVDMANIYSTTPSILDNGFVTLEDPENLIKAQNVVPLVNTAKMNPDVTAILDKVSAALTTEDLTEMNRRNQGDEKAEPAAIAADWLKEKALF
ncbi:ABC transporter substrate-binding protein [Clavibacter michiganensis]|uniref:ABC transporter substrate-binding protein n=1 Tax=Clavibacter michiganensis TaxID=28447 RepID=UPI000A37D160|nr:ABC transporter substrate-binding protein [Clavibacter michiganensis]KAF0257905.1 putative osmoprotectant uptake system substrate-binding protein OsmF precursor [Clavibacter michiganensis subsp. michiganensis]MBW8026555.1 glycine/betaine ABC transporter [Clavibacter michiganensis subsp. michiganensis]MDO4142400.1 glycine betaine ABC transporter substrate-binding protein [Clavibacter michiganensis]OUD94928.1 putative osmoprotectant uptake system substrate-binding protein OsmF precursor [Clavi